MTGSAQHDWKPYVVPFGVYMGFLLVQSRFPLDALLWLYPLKTIATAAALIYYWKRYDELRRDTARGDARPPKVQSASLEGERPREPISPCAPSSILLGILIGTIAIVIWIWIDPFYPSISAIFGKLSNVINSLQGEPTVEPPSPEIFNPMTIEAVGLRWTFIAFRVFGAAVVVAFMEELFWRGFLIRWLIKEDFKSVPLGAFTWGSCLITVLFFGLEHDLWLAGLICGVLYNWLYYRTRSIPACVIAHGVSNALLAAYVLTTGDWKFW